MHLGVLPILYYMDPLFCILGIITNISMHVPNMRVTCTLFFVKAWQPHTSAQSKSFVSHDRLQVMLHSHRSTTRLSCSFCWKPCKLFTLATKLYSVMSNMKLLYISNKSCYKLGKCRTLWGKCEQVALTCYIGKPTPLKCQITAHRPWYVAKLGLSLYCLQKCSMLNSLDKNAEKGLSWSGTIQWSHLFYL